MPRLPIPTDSEEFSEETRSAIRHIKSTRKSMPPPSSYLTYAGEAGARLSDLVEYLRYHTSLTDAESELAICTAVAGGGHTRRSDPCRRHLWAA